MKDQKSNKAHSEQALKSKLAEPDGESSAARLRFTQFSLDRSAEAAFWMGPDLRFVYVNDAACRSLGYSREELLSMAVTDIDVEFPGSLPNYWDELRRRKSMTIESRHRTKDGNIFDVEVSANYLEWEGKEYNCAFARNITERKKIEKQQQILLEIDQAADIADTLEDLLEIIHLQLGRIMDTSNFGVALYDQNRDEYTFPFTTDPYDEPVTFTREQLGKSLTDYVRRTGLPLFVDEETDQRLREQGEVELVGHPSNLWLGAPLKTPAGTIGVVSVQSYDEGSCYTIQDLELLSLVSDRIARVIERKRAEAALRESERRYRTTLESMGDAIHVVDTDLRLILVNDTLKKWCVDLGLNRVKSGNKLTTAFPFLSRRVIDEYNEVISCGKTLITEETTPIAGQDIATETRKIAIVEGDRVTSVITVLRDITDRKQLENQLRQAQKMEAVGILAGGVAHDFNNILTGITGYAELALKGLPLRSAPERHLSEIRDLSDRAAELTRQLLAFSRQQTLTPVVLSANGLIEGTLRMLRRLIGEDISLVYNLDAEEDLIEADRGQIEQVLMNLAVNARDAMPRGGQISIETKTQRISATQASGANITPGHYVFIRVSDTGSGMDEETARRIFEPFFTTKEIGKGTGLGLSTVWGIIRQHDGYISVESSPGQGTSFEIWLPRASKPLVEEIPESILPAPPGSEGILIVEDEEQLASLIEEVLADQGYKVFCTSSPGDAYEILKHHGEEIDLLLTDVIMPRESGPELFTQLSQRSPSLRVLYMSGYTDRALVQSDLLKPGIAFLQKPFSPDELGLKVREALS